MKKIISILLIIFLSSTVFYTNCFCASNWDTICDNALSFTFSDKDKYRYDIVYRLIPPKDYDPSKKYPLILELTHERGDDNISQLTNSIAKTLTSEKFADKYPCFILLPMCPNGTHWYTGLKHPMNDVMEATLDILNHITTQYSIDTSRIYTGGIVSGATSAWELIARRPDLFAAAFFIAGAPSDSTMAQAILDVPLWAFDSSDNNDPINNTRYVISEMRNLGANPKYTEFPYGQHFLWSRVYNNPNFYEWLFKQKKTETKKLLFKDVDNDASYFNPLLTLVNNDIIDNNLYFYPNRVIKVSESLNWGIRCALYYKSGIIPELSPEDYNTLAQQMGFIHTDNVQMENNTWTKKMCMQFIVDFLSQANIDMEQYTHFISDATITYPEYQHTLLPYLNTENVSALMQDVTRSQFASTLYDLLQSMEQFSAQTLTINTSNNMLEYIGNTEIELVGERDIIRTSETCLGNLITNAMLLETQADVAVMQAGGIRASIPEGNITRQNIYSVLPFDNTVVLLEVTGADIMKILENSFSLYPQPSTSFLQIAGMTVKVNPEDSNRITEVTINNQPLVENKTYKLATNNYIAEGGDNFTVLANLPVLAQYDTIASVVCNYIQYYGIQVESIYEKRIQFLS